MHNNIRHFGAEDAQVAFPLGGIGTGNISLGARGDLRDWELFNRPGKEVPFPNTFFAIRVQAADQPAITRVLEGPLQPPYNLSHGYHPWTAAGLPRLAGTTFRGEYPLATVEFNDPHLPVQVRLEAFTPLIPLNPDDSGLPCAVLTYHVQNPTADTVDLTLVGSLINPIGEVGYDLFGNIAAGGTGLNVNEYRQETNVRGLFLHSQQYAADHLRYGDLSLATDHEDVTVKRAWLRGAWYDFLREFWDDLSDDGRMTDLNYETPSPMGKTDTGSLGLLDTLLPGESRSYRFLLTWYFPNRTNSWDNNPEKPLVRNHYTTQFASSWMVATYLAEQLPRLEEETRRFHQALHGSTLPPAVLDAVSANIVPLRSPTCFWLEDGRFFGFEGCFDGAGCCEGSCTHVWSYAQTLAYLFPSLEREMRRIEFTIETNDSGYMYFRTHQTFDSQFVWGNQEPEAAVDGQMGSILRAYREWLLSGDRAWLEMIWPGIKRAIAFAATHWDTDRDHVLDGRQHNTYDIEFYGPNPLSNIYYLGALRAVEALAEVMEEPDLARRARETFTLSSQRMEKMLWNGRYYIQQIDDVDAYPYQHGRGCLSDQLLGQLHAKMLGLGDLLPDGRARTALKSIHTHNFKRDFQDHVNCQRTYVLNDESGLLLCTWPEGGRPRFPFVYSDEVWTGIEYQVAAHLIYEGWLEEGLEVVTAVRARHDGRRRNPWNEVECGHHYARSMSSWALLLALSGFHCDVASGLLAFAPAINGADFRCFFSAGTGWGSFSQQEMDEGEGVVITLTLEYGRFRLCQLNLDHVGEGEVTVELDGQPVAAMVEDGQRPIAAIHFSQPLTLHAGHALQVYLSL